MTKAVVGAIAFAVAALSCARPSAEDLVRPAPGAGPSRSVLTLRHVGSDSSALHAIATLVSGPTEAILWDAHYRLADARRLADTIAASGRTLKAIVVSHPDHDHFAGAAVILERFPGTPVYMTAAGVAEFGRSGFDDFRPDKARNPGLLADSLVTPSVLPSLRLTIDGEPIEIIPDLTGDAANSTNSVLWIPRLRAALVSDIAFDRVHPWLAPSDRSTRAAWRRTLATIERLGPAIVVAGHKRDVTSPDSPQVLDVMDAYLADFDAALAASPGRAALIQRLHQRYPDHAIGLLLRASVHRLVPPDRP